MTLAAKTFCEDLEACVNYDYFLHNAADGKVMFAERYFRQGDVKPKERKIKPLLPGSSRRISLRKLVFAENDNPSAYLVANRQLNAEPSIHCYHFDEVDGQPLAALLKTSMQEI